MTRVRTRREAGRSSTINVLVIGAAWAAAQPLLCTTPPGLLIAWMTNGLVFSVYAGCLFAIRRGAENTTRAVALAVLGCTHFVWVLPLGYLANKASQLIFPKTDFGMWIATAAVLGTGVAVATLRWWAALLPLACWGMSVLLERLFPSGLMNLMNFGLMTGAIHVGLLAALALDAYEYWCHRRPVWGCAHCGYDVRNLTSPMCPECGKHPTSADGGWTHD